MEMEVAQVEEVEAAQGVGMGAGKELRGMVVVPMVAVVQVVVVAKVAVVWVAVARVAVAMEIEAKVGMYKEGVSVEKVVVAMMAGVKVEVLRVQLG
ncbi:MAG: hypothetical protein SGPRY_003025 [Prymnesium sp.]